MIVSVSRAIDCERSACHGFQQVTVGAGQNASRLLACRAGVHVDLHANRHFNDLRSLPSHLALPCSGATRTGAERKTAARLTQGLAESIPVSTNATTFAHLVSAILSGRPSIAIPIDCVETFFNSDRLFLARSEKAADIKKVDRRDRIRRSQVLEIQSIARCR
jgi:hypothetical protein